MPRNELSIERELLSPPGDTILETIEHIKMSQAELADRLGKTASKVHDLITGKEPITYNTALQLEKVLGIDAQFWLKREINYRTKLARIEQEEALEDAKKKYVGQEPNILALPMTFKKAAVHLCMKDPAQDCMDEYGHRHPCCC